MVRVTYDKPVAVASRADGASSEQPNQDVNDDALRAQKLIEYKIDKVGCSRFAEKWQRRLQTLEAFVRLHNKRPSQKSKDVDEKRLGRWTTEQLLTYAKNSKIMKDPAIRKGWQVFVDAHVELFQDNVTTWRRHLSSVKEFIEARSDDGEGGEDKQIKKPSSSSNDPNEKKLAAWINQQQH
eukprot:6099436-Pleurochrysis_carterae.AAC.1